MQNNHAGTGNRSAIVAILLAVAALSFGDALVKLLSAEAPIWQLFVLRSLIAIVMLLVVMRGRLRRLSSPGWVVLRSMLLTAMWITYYAALPSTPLSLAAAGYYTIPLFLVLFSAPLLRERVGPRGWAAACLGFAGVIVMLRPDPADITVTNFLPVIAAALYALAMIITRARCQADTPLMMALILNVVFVATGAVVTAVLWALAPSAEVVVAHPFLLAGWAATDLRMIVAMAVLAVAVIIGASASAFAYQTAPPALIGVFDYAYLALAALWGFLLFAETPDLVGITGMAMIVGAGILVLKR